jgi:hypothetical protein
MRSGTASVYCGFVVISFRFRLLAAYRLKQRYVCGVFLDLGVGIVVGVVHSLPLCIIGAN